MKPVVLIVLIFSSAVYSKVILEPYAGYATGSGDQKLSGSTCVGDPRAAYSYREIIYGGRLGVGLDSKITAGVDYSTSTFTLESDIDGYTPTATTENKTYFDKVTKTQIGAFVRLAISGKYSVRGTYFFDSEIKGEDLDKYEFQAMNITDIYMGKGFGAGVGYHISKKAVIHAEYRSFEYDEWEKKNGIDSDCGIFGNRASAGASNMQISEYMLSISLLFDL